jgi:hypothetical protein
MEIRKAFTVSLCSTVFKIIVKWAKLQKDSKKSLGVTSVDGNVTDLSILHSTREFMEDKKPVPLTNNPIRHQI